MKPVLKMRTMFHHDYRQLSIRHDQELGILWYFMRPEPRPCFTPELIDNINCLQKRVTHLFNAGHNNQQEIRFLVLGSRMPGVFNLGGDLCLFLRLIKDRNREELTEYAKACIEILYQNTVALNLPVTTISLVQGDALGGGFEAALSSQVLIAEKGTKMGLPEIMFNLFPGMGAYSFLTRRLNAAHAERMILNPRNYTAEELYDMGLVDVLAENGQGEEAVYAYVKKQKRFGNGTAAIHKVRQRCHPVTFEELMDITLLWVDAALRLEHKDLRIMERLVRAQDRLNTASVQFPRGSAA